MKKGLITILIIITLIPNIVLAKTSKNIVNIYFFHSNTCSHCKAEEEILKIIDDKYENVKVYKYEIHNESNKIILNEIKKELNIFSNAVPITIIGNKYYVGYSDEKSPAKFIKTIEYFSRYSYDDKVMKIIDPNYISNYHESPYIKREDFKKFMKEYQNYKLLGLETDKITPNTTSLIMGVISVINPVTIITILVMLLLLKKVMDPNNKMIILILFFSLSPIFKLDVILKNDIYHLITSTLLLVLFTYSLIRYYKARKISYLIFNLIIILSSLMEYILSIRYHKYLLLLKDVAQLNLLRKVDLLSYYSSYIVCIYIVYTIILLLIYLFYQKWLRR